MDAQFSAARDGRAQVSYYRHQQRIDQPSTELHSSLYRYRGYLDQVPLNFFGRQTLRAPGDDLCMFCPRPLDGVWRAESHIPIMRTQPVQAQMH